ncbi:MAG: cytochrome c biogenesis protein ResB [Desulfuromonadales bacterium]|nr:cytochrome c biogenesis protein ResB [Desulfuromonadales bacterium]
MATTQRNFIESVWDFFCSLKLTMFLLISLALTSIIGTVLPQGPTPPEYIAQISALKLAMYTKLGFFDMYHSWWFIALLYVFSLNLTCCSIKRLPHVFTFISHPALVLSESLQKSYTLKQEVVFSTPADIARKKLADFLKTELAAPIETEQGGVYHLFAQKTAWCRLGVYVVHASILVIFIGAIIGSLFGDKGFVNIVEGESINSFVSRSGKNTPLGFTVRCDQFSVAKYSTGAPKEFKSILTVLENGVPVPAYTNARVIVNDPMTYRGFTFYQSSYGQASEGSEHYLTVAPRGGSASQRITFHEGERVSLKDGTLVKLIGATQEVQQIIPELNGPAAQIEVTFKGKSPQVFEIFKNYPEINAQRGDELVFGYDGTNARLFTGLQVAKDPGVWVVWLGCALMVAGLFIAFFMSHKRVWIVVSKGHARMYGNASKNQAAFSLQFDDLSAKLKELQI